MDLWLHAVPAKIWFSVDVFARNETSLFPSVWLFAHYKYIIICIKLKSEILSNGGSILWLILAGRIYNSGFGQSVFLSLKTVDMKFTELV